MRRRSTRCDRFEKLNREFIGENISLARTQGMFMPTLQAMVGLAFLLVLWAGGSTAAGRQITLGNFVMFNTYMGMLVWPMIALGWVVNLMQRGTASLARIDESDAAEAVHRSPADPAPLSRARGEIEFRDVAWNSARPAAWTESICAFRREHRRYRRAHRQR